MSNLFSPQHLQNLCAKYGLRPSKKYGQNFLINPEPVEKMLEAAGVGKADMVVEVGPGFGALTLALAARAGRVAAYEIEKKLAPYWDDALKVKDFSSSAKGGLAKPAENGRGGMARNIEIIWGNVLRADMPAEKYKVVANLPYQITSNVIRKFLEEKNRPELLTLMVQKEVAERICARPGQMSMLALSVQYYAVAEIVAVVPRTDFWPTPEVDSAVVKITLHKTRPDAATAEKIFKLARAGFAAKRKLLVKNLAPFAEKEKIRGVFAELGISPTARAQELSVAEWILLAEKLL